MFSLSASFRGGRGGSAVNRLRGLKNFSPSYQLLLLERQNRCVQRPVSSSFSTRLNPPEALGPEGEERVRSYFQTSEGSKVAEKLVKIFRRLRAVTLADRERVVRLAVAVDDHEGDLLELGFADSLANGVVALVDLDAVTGLAQLGRESAGRFAVILPDRQHAQLHRREPERELAAVVFDQDPDEALERPQQRAVDHIRRVLLVVRAHVRQLEPGGHLRVELNRAHLPGATEHVRHMEVDLRPVERAVALVDEVVDSSPVKRV